MIEVLKDNAFIMVWFCYFSVDESVGKVGLSSIKPRGTEDQPWDSAPIDGSEAHRTRFATWIYNAATEVFALNVLARISDRHYLGVSCWVYCADHRVASLAYYFALLVYYDCTKRPTILLDIAASQIDKLVDNAGFELFGEVVVRRLGGLEAGI